ncbi:hypothetical protein [Arsukibacterium perlucidum]|uniref:hypothetical protein n=1 Tax=Arsukibacterium perlucidum TaxID=368811 RepID=UPI0003744304|nr:hypothetical protein [Arsukibacterium perlucidum]
MTDQFLQKKYQHLLLFKLLEQVKATELQLQHQNCLNELQLLEQAIAESDSDLVRHQNFVSQVFCPELKQLQLKSLQRQQHETTRLANELRAVSQRADTIRSAYNQCNYVVSAYREAAVPVINSLRERKTERHDQQINALHYQRKYNGHG